VEGDYKLNFYCGEYIHNIVQSLNLVTKSQVWKKLQNNVELRTQFFHFRSKIVTIEKCRQATK